MLEIDAPVWVWVEGQEMWHPAHFAGYEHSYKRYADEPIGVWIQGRTSHSGFGAVVYYNKWRTDEEHRTILNREKA